MCTNSARLVNSLECYMDELVENFEDFVKKSLLIISIAVGALIVMLGYVLKVITERAQMMPIASTTGEGWSRQFLPGSPSAEERTTQFLSGSTAAEGWSRFLPGSTSAEESPAERRQEERRQAEEKQGEGWTRFFSGPTTAKGRQADGKQTDVRQVERWTRNVFPGSATVEGRQAEGRQAEGGQQAQGRKTEGRTRQFFTNLSSSTEYPQSSRSNSSLPVDAAKGSRSGPLPQKSSIKLPMMRNEFEQTSSTGANTGPISSLPSFDEKVLRNVGLSSCSKSCMQSRRSIMRNCSSPRIAIPSMPTCIPNHHLSNPRPCTKFMKNRSSCCSMCCADDDRR